jgi:type VI secretion system protein ImpA
LIDAARFTGALTQDAPSGPNLEYDPDFLALERAQQGKPEQRIGAAVNAGEEPDWRDVAARAEALLGRTRDLRIAVSLTAALLKIDGFKGFAVGLALIRGLLEGLWDSVHPQLDADDNDDPTLRLNSLMSLAAASGFLKNLWETPVVQSKLLGRFNLRDIRIAAGKLPPPANAEPPQQVQIDAAFRDADLPSLEDSAAQVAVALQNARSIERLLIDKVGAQAPTMKPLVVDLAEIEKVLAEKLASRGAGAPRADEVQTETQQTAPGRHTGDIRSREDVVLLLDRLCEYYRRHEPSSPIPVLLRRAKRLVSKDFMDIIRDLTPSGIPEAELLAGAEKSND